MSWKCLLHCDSQKYSQIGKMLTTEQQLWQICETDANTPDCMQFACLPKLSTTACNYKRPSIDLQYITQRDLFGLCPCTPFRESRDCDLGFYLRVHWPIHSLSLVCNQLHVFLRFFWFLQSSHLVEPNVCLNVLNCRKNHSRSGGHVVIAGQQTSQVSERMIIISAKNSETQFQKW